MKRNKKLERIAESSMAKYSNSNVKYELKKIVVEKYEKKRISIPKPVFFASLATAMTIIIVVSLIAFLPRKTEIPQERNYADAEIVSYKATYEDIKKEMSHVEFAFPEDAMILRLADSEYNDTLYYYVSFNTDEGDEYVIRVVTNPDYVFNFNRTFSEQTTLCGYEFDYYETFKFDGVYYDRTAYGILQTEKEKIYVKYYGFGFDESSAFVENLQKIIV